MRTTGATLVVRALEDEGVRFTFGIPGTHNIELYDALDSSATIRPILVTDEQSASFMADGLARSSGAIGVVNLVPGAGVTHALSGIAEALLDCVPIVVLACGIRNDTGAAYQLHDIDQAALLAPVTKRVFQPERSSELYAAVREAFAIARSGVPGPVAVIVPANLYMLGDEVPEPVAPAPPPAPAAPDPDLIQQAAALLNDARHPALYVGFGARAATAGVRAIAEALAAPVCSTIQGKGVLDERHPLFLWPGFGRSAPPFVRKVMERCDALLAIGCRFGEVATASYGLTPPEALIHVDVDPAVFNRNVPAQVAIASDARAFCSALLPRIAPRGRDERLERRIADGHARVGSSWKASPDRVTPASLFEALGRLCPGAVFTADSGNGTFLAMEHLRLPEPGRFLAPVDYSCMGYAVPAAIGAKLAAPDRDVIALAGDGALLMTGLELLTAAAYRAAPLVLVLRDGELAQIAQFQRTTMNRATASVLHPYRVDALAAACGCEHVAVENDGEIDGVLASALERTRAGFPVMAEVAIDYSQKTYFTRGVVATNLLRLPWSDRLRMVGRALGRRVAPRRRSRQPAS